MKIVIIGGTGLIGRQLAGRLAGEGHDVIAASPSTGVNAVTGAGLADAVTGADVVVDVSNAPSFADAPVMAFFEASATNIADAARTAGVRHLIALSVVGTDTLQGSGYFRAKLAQEQRIAASGVPFTIVRATQFFEFMGAIAEGYTRDGVAYLPTFALQPIASADVAEVLAEIATGTPLGGTLEISGPERAATAGFVWAWLDEQGDRREVVKTTEPDYFGAIVDDQTLVPSDGARIMPTRFDAWLSAQRVGEAA